MSAQLPAPGDPRAPKFWRYETSGLAADAVQAYLSGGPMTSQQLAVMQAYLRQWIMSPVWDAGSASELDGLRDMIGSLHSREQITTWLHKAIEIGIDPL